jgi:hypothetical protein
VLHRDAKANPWTQASLFEHGSTAELRKVALVSDRLRTARVSAASSARVLVGADGDVRRLMREVPSIRPTMLEAFVERLATGAV